MILLTVAIGCLLVPLLLPALSDMISVARVLTRGRKTPSPQPPPQRLLFLVPAHNEELLISSCLSSLSAMRYPRAHYDIVVIADNCVDRTAERVRAAGVRCLERREPELPGKPRAIAWALERLTVSDYDGVVILDADVIVDGGFAPGIAAAGPLAKKAVQPYNDVRNPDETAVTKMAAVLAAGMYRGSFALKQAAGLNIPLSAGMCIGSEILGSVGWTAFTMSEDWEWYAILVSRGVRIELASTAHLFAQEAKSLRQSETQRRRWTAGKISTLLHRGPEILRSGTAGPRQKLDALAELAAVGPAVQLGFVVGATTIAAVGTPPMWQLLVIAALGSLARPTCYALIGLAKDPSPIRAIRAFAFLPVYTVWRVLAVIGTVRMIGDKRWIRTARHQDRTA